MTGLDTQYARTTDGVRIALSVTGSGPPLVITPHHYGSIDVAWRLSAGFKSFIEALAGHHTVILYDCRGTGASDRQPNDFSLLAMERDLEAVVQRLGLTRFALLGTYHIGLAAIAYAARHPDQVSRLVLWQAYVSHTEAFSAPQVEATRNLIEQDWQLYTEIQAMVALGWDAGREARHLAAQIRETISAENARAAVNATRDYDVRPYLASIAVPTLVLHRRDSARYPAEMGRRLAAEIDGARLTLVDGESLLCYLGDERTVLESLLAFLAEDAPSTKLSSTVRDPELLSARELEVVRLVSAGLTNREIAERLVISPGTASLHVKHVLAKLGFRSRSQIAAWVVESGLAVSRSSG